MDNIERKKEIFKILSGRDTPISAACLALKFGVTRQIIVKDISLLKAEKKDIISTAKGYLLGGNVSTKIRRTIKVCHTAKEIEDELNTVVDLGGYVVSTAVEHPVYGTMGETLDIKSRKDVRNFLSRISETGCEPLLRLTQGKHMHIIEGESEECLDEICEELTAKGYLITE